MKNIPLIIMLCILSQVVHSKVETFQLADNTIEIKTLNEGNRYSFIHLHNNEITSFDAAILVLKKCNATMVSLQHSGDRNISFTLNTIVLTLSLFMFWVLTDNHNYTFAPYYFALGTYFFY